MKKLLFLALVIFGYHIAKAQSDCQVKLKAINKSYKGGCKKNLAHGQGEASGEKDAYTGNFKKGYPHGPGSYTWGNGNTYQGDFVKGKMEGKGTLKIVNVSGEIEIQKGYFKNNEYIGEYKTPYNVTSLQGIRKIDFQESNEATGNTNDVKIKIYLNGALINPPVTVLDINNTYVENRNDMTILRNALFPLKNVDISFTSGAFSYRAIFEIYQKGNWAVSLFL